MKGKGPSFVIVLGFAVMFLLIAAASDAVVVLSNNTTNIGNIIIINADSPDPAVNGTALLNTLAGLTGTSDNRFVIKLGPGTYDVGTGFVAMKDYVDIEGSGENVTLITGHPDGPATIIALGVSNVEIRFLKVQNTGGGSLAVAIGTGSPVNITHVTAVAKGATTNHAIQNHCPSPPCDTVVIKDVYAHVEDNNSTENVGIHSDDNSNVAMINVIAEVSGTVNGTAGASTASVGIRNVNMAQIIMMEVYAIVSGGASTRGIRNNGTNNGQMFNVYAFAMDATGQNYGIFNSNSAPIMRNIRTEGSGGTDSIGLFNNNCSTGTTMTSIVAHGHNATATNIGISNNGCSHVFYSTVANSTPGKAGAAHYGIKNVDASLKIESSYITSPAADAVCGSGCYGVHSTMSTGGPYTIKIDTCQICTAPTSSSAATIYNGTNVTTYVGSSKLEGNAVQNAGTMKCVGSYNATYDPLNNSTCL